MATNPNQSEERSPLAAPPGGFGGFGGVPMATPQSTSPLAAPPGGFGGFGMSAVQTASPVNTAQNTQIPTLGVNQVETAGPKEVKKQETPKDWIKKQWPGNLGLRLAYEADAESQGKWGAVELISEEKAEKKYGAGTKTGKGLGNTQPGDGFKFRGRSFFQLSGKYNYDKVGKMIGVNLVENPDAVLDPEVARLAFIGYLEMKKKQGHDLSTLAGAHKAIGPHETVEERRARLAKQGINPPEDDIKPSKQK